MALEEAERVRLKLEKCVRENCTYYSRGEVLIVYCVWYADKDGNNQDFAYTFQVDGEPDYVSVQREQLFQSA